MSVIWTPIPAGRRPGDGAPVLSVLVSPRLQSADGQPAALSAFAPFVDWPATLRTLSLAVSFNDGPDVPVALVDAAAASSELWAAVFPADGTVVRSHQPEDFSQHQIVSYRSVRARDALRGLYADSAVTFPARPPEGEEWGALIRRGDRVGEAAAEVLAFHAPLPPAGDPLPPTPAELAGLLDFHALVSALGDHPALLRACGLLFDVLLGPDAPLSDVPGLLAVRPHFDASDVLPRVQAELNASVFVALPYESRVYLPLRDGDHDLVEVDVDGALLKFDALHAALNGKSAPPGPDAPSAISLPSLRSGGLSVTLDARGQALAARLAEHAGFESLIAQGGSPVLDATQLERGYVIDVHDGDAWRSLCRRRGTYRITRAPELAIELEDVEGFVQLAVTAHAAVGGGAPALKLHESLARWQGWSLVAPRPGRALSHESDPASPPVEPANDPLTTAGVAVDWRVEPGTLPALRFGRGYRMRARSVDLAGHAIALAAADDSQALPVAAPLRYRRFEPVTAPTSVLRAPLDPDANAGESSDRLVLRTANPSPELDEAPGAAGGDRQLVPPRASVELAEAHGALDDASGRPRADLYPLLRDRDAAQLGTDAAGLVTLEPAERLVVPYLPDPLARGVALRDLPGTAEGTLGTIGADGRLTYAPLAGEIVRPGSATLLPFDFDGGWPDAVGLRIAIADGSGPPQWDAAQRLLTVQLAKGSLSRIPLSCFIWPDDLELMAVWQWMREAVDEIQTSAPSALSTLADDVAQATQLALEGGHWMLTPARSLVLVSAVRQPLGAPRFDTLSADRPLGSTAATLTGTLRLHGASTARVELLAEWTEPIDRDDGAPPQAAVPFSAVADELILNAPGPGQHNVVLRTGGRRVGSWIVAEDRIELDSHQHPRHELHDTRHRRIRYRARSATRFREYFPPADAGDFTRTGPPIEVDVPASARPPAPQVLYAVPTFGWERLQDTNLRVSRRLGGGLRVYLARPWFASGEGERLGVVCAAGRLDDALRASIGRYVTQWGRDPTVVADPTGADPDFDSFPRRTETLTDLSLPEVGAAARVNVAGHDLDFDAAMDAWSCDIELEPGTAYRPFVRLAVARLQSHAVDGAQLSPVVLLDWAQLAPDRAVLVTRDPALPNRINVTVSGTTFSGSAASETGGRVELGLQERNDAFPEEIGWFEIPVIDWGAPEVGSGTTLLWRGSFDLPTGGEGRGPFRLVVRELEDWPADAGRTPRVAYFDVLPLPGGAPGPASEPALAWTDWTSAAPTGALGHLRGQGVALQGAMGTAFYLHEDYPGFSSPVFSPALPLTGMVEIAAAADRSFTIAFDAPVRDPIVHIGSCGSTLEFPAGTAIARLGGDDGFTVSGSTVSGVARNPADSNGSIQLTGVFDAITFATTPNFVGGSGEDGIFLQIGGVLG